MIFHLSNRACAFEKENGVAQKLTQAFSTEMDENEKFCKHSEWERGFITEATHIELNMALSRFYRVTHVYAAYHWTEWSSELFKPYIRKAMELKLSGLPPVSHR